MCWVMRMEIYLIKCNYIYLKAIPIIGCSTNQNVLQTGSLTLWLCHMCRLHIHIYVCTLLQCMCVVQNMDKECLFAFKMQAKLENGRYIDGNMAHKHQHQHHSNQNGPAIKLSNQWYWRDSDSKWNRNNT